jgi:phosphonate transport system permease protein
VRFSGALALAVLAGVLWASAAILRFDPSDLASTEALRSMSEYLFAFFPPDLSGEYLGRVGKGAVETLAISAVSTALAALLGLLLALPAAGRFGTAAMAVARLLLNALRSIPELVFAALMVLAAGLGPFAGTLALALHTTGVLGRLFAEALENAPREPAEALLHSGSPRLAAFFLRKHPHVDPPCKP